MAANMICMWKPAQSGKTRTIQEIIREDDGVKNHLNIIICSNNRGLVAQTRARMHNDMVVSDDDMSVDEDWNADDAVVGGVYSWMSGTKKTNVTARDLALRVLMNEVSMVVCCSHKARFRYLHELLTLLERAKYGKPVNVWIDEADVSVRYWSGEYDFARFACVRNVYPVSATFGSVFDYYERIRVMPFPETHPQCYRGLTDCELVEMDAPAGGSGAYLDAVLTAHPEIAQAGMRLFVPGDIERSSHTAIADFLTARGFIVLVLNGVEKGFRFPDGRVVPIDLPIDDDAPEELSRALAKSYEAYEMECYPFAVTGQLCLGRGITFQSNGFLFDFAILAEMKDDSNAYQCAARVLGNTAEFDNGFPVTVYLTPRMRVKIERQERIAKNLARLVHEEGWVGVGEEEVRIAAEEADMLWSTDPEWVPNPDPRKRLEVSAEMRLRAMKTPMTFATVKEAKKWGEAHLFKTPVAMYPCAADREKTAETHYILGHDCVPILTVQELLRTSRLSAGQGKSREVVTGSPRCHPVLVDGQVRFLVVFKTFWYM